MKQNASRNSGDMIDQNLRKAFKEIEEEELPDRFKDLLARLHSGEELAVSSDAEASE